MSSTARRFAALTLLLGLTSCEDGVGPAVPTSMIVGSEAVDLMVGGFVPMAAQVLDQQGRVMERVKPVFTSSDPSVVTVDAAGTLRGVSLGTAEAAAIYGNLRARVSVTVIPDDRALIRSLEVGVDSLVADTRGGAQLVDVQMLNGRGQSVCAQLTFHSSDPVVATARAAGSCRLDVVPHFAGQATITVSSGAGSDSFRVRVTSAGDVAFFTDRPVPGLIVAGSSGTFGVRAIDHTGAPLVGTRVYFSVTIGELTSTSVLTDADGYARTRWHYPLHLSELGQNHAISFRTQLPTGYITGGTEAVFIDGVSLDRLELYSTRQPSAGWTPIAGQFVWPRFDLLYIGAKGLDPYGNVRRLDPTFSSSLSLSAPLTSGDFSYVRIYLYSSGTYTITVNAEGMSQSAQVTVQ